MKIFASIAVIGNKIKQDYVSAFAAQSSLFIIMGFVPFILLLTVMVRFTPLTPEMLLDLVSNIAPDAFMPSIESIIYQMYAQVKPSWIILTAITVLWVAGKGFHSIIDGLNSVFDIKEKRSDFVIRLYSILYTIVLVIVIAICIIIFVLGNHILAYVNHFVPIIGNLIETILNFRALISVVLLTFFFTFMYVFIPSRHTKIRRQIPGALFSAVGWTGFSFFFSLYVQYSSTLSLLYGSLSTIICAMLWLYVCMFIFLIGAEINLFAEQWNMGKSVDKATIITHSDTH